MAHRSRTIADQELNRTLCLFVTLGEDLLNDSWLTGQLYPYQTVYCFGYSYLSCTYITRARF